MYKYLFFLAIFTFNISNSQTITTVAGSGVIGFDGDGGPAIDAKLFTPVLVTLDLDGNILFSDNRNHRVRKVNLTNEIINSIAGSGASGPGPGSYGGDGGLATNAFLNYPNGITLDEVGNIYLADNANHRIRKIEAATGVITTVAGNGIAGFSGDGSLAINAQLYGPTHTLFLNNNELLIADQRNHRIRKVDLTTGLISTFAGSGPVGPGPGGFAGDGGLAENAILHHTAGMAFDNQNNLVFVDQGNHKIRKINLSTNIINTIAGTGPSDPSGGSFAGDGGPAINALFDTPTALAFDYLGNLYITDLYNNRVRMIDINGIISTVVGSGPAGNGTGGYGGDNGPAISALLNYPNGLVFDNNWNLYITDQGNQRIRKVEGLINSPPIAFAQNLTVSAGLECSVDVTPQQVDNGSSDPDGDSLSYVLEPAGPYYIGENPVLFIVSDGVLSDSTNTTITVTGGYANVIGKVLTNGQGLENIIVKLLESANPTNFIETTTDSSGAYTFSQVELDSYQVMIVVPLGYILDNNFRPVYLGCGSTEIVDFSLNEITILNNARSKGFWKHQFDVYVKEKGHAQETAGQLQIYIDEVHARYALHFNLFDGKYSFEDWQTILSVKGKAGMEAKAISQIAALALNIMSLKIAQFEVVTDDDYTAGDVLTFVSGLILDGDQSNDELAKDLAEAVCNQQTIAAGIVQPTQNILYKGRGGLAFENKIPTEFKLRGNYPNPFNPGTKIAFDLPKDVHVKLEIYNALGQKTFDLVDAFYPTGYHQVVWHANEYSSGIYYYRIKAGSFSEIKKMILMK